MTSFYRRRCIRLLPAYVVMCVMFEAFAYCFPSTAALAQPSMLAEFLLTANYYWQEGSQPYPIISHVWTLATEWQFYLVWPLLMLIASKLKVSKPALLAVMSAMIVAVWIARLRGHNFFRVDGLLLGACVALLKDSASISKKIEPIAIPLLGICGAVIGLLFFNDFPRVANQAPTIVVAAAAVVVLVIATNGKPIFDALLGNHLLRYFGKISYGLYLYHFPIAAALYVNGATGPKMLIVCAFASIPLADFSFRFIENPIIQFGKRRPADASAEPLHSQPISQ